jgi:hypothetical protein
MKQGHRFLTFAAACAAFGLFATAPANAVTHSGGEFTVSASQVDANTVDFVYTADFTNWTGDFDFIFAIDFGLSNPKVASIDSFSTTALGSWAAEIGNTSANGCGGGSSVFACAEDLPLDTNNAQRTIGIVTWSFRITFDANLTSAAWLDDDNHIGAFFFNCGTAPDWGTCQSGNGLSQETTFGDDDDDDDDDDDTDMPEPGTLALLGLGLLGLGLSRRRQAK